MATVSTIPQHRSTFMFIYMVLGLTLLAMVSTFVRWSVETWARLLSVCLLQYDLLRKALFDSNDGRARTATRLRPTLILIVIASRLDPFIIFV
jgi:hypothetical protein